MWTWIQFKNVLWFRRGLPPKARDFNWHNVIGFWIGVPLAIVVAGAVPISYPWASNLVYRMAGDTPPPAAAAAPPRARPSSNRSVCQRRIDAAWSAAAAAGAGVAHDDDAARDVREGADRAHRR